MKILIDFESTNVRNRVRSMFAEERILRIGYFDVCLDEATSGGTMYIKLKGHSHVEQVLEKDTSMICGGFRWGGAPKGMDHIPQHVMFM